MAGERPTNAREQMPQCAGFIDDMRDHFNAPVRIVAEENGHSIEWGQPASRGVWVVASPASEHTRSRAR